MEDFKSTNGQLWRSNTVGGDGGKDFSDIHWPPQASERTIAKSAVPTEVRIRLGRYLDQIQMIWSTQEFTAHGGKGADLESFALSRNEYIANVRLTAPSKRYVGSVELITSAGRSVIFGKQKGTVVDLGVPPNHKVIGFYGSSGRWVDQLGVIAASTVTTLHPQATIPPTDPPNHHSAGKPDQALLDAIPRSGIELIKEFEGYAQALPDGRAKAYADPLLGWEVPTIGYGTTRYPNGEKVREGDVITQSEAEDYLIHHVDQSCRSVLEKIPTWDQMTSNQQGALYSFAYNLGAGFYRGSNFESITRVCDSPERWQDQRWIAAQFVKYRNPGSSVEAGLKRRRLAEADLFCKPVTAAIPNWQDDHDEAVEASDRKPEERLDKTIQAVAGHQSIGAGFTPEMSFDTLITPHITYGEFARYEEERRFRYTYQCQTAYDICLFLEKCRAHFGGNPLVITSGYRPPEINARIGGARRSEHLYDTPDKGAVDFYIKGVSIYEVEAWCDQNYPYSIGYGAARGFVHLGMRPGKPRVRWVY
ncbi:MAG: D-Ala-D-Ala carboxypeptidase family metallohydrolase [Cyanobacteria bacterium P01_D01_bin.156]